MSSEDELPVLNLRRNITRAPPVPTFSDSAE
eukprot:COSAG05_NODE_22772_length_262_cov_0.944785_1_plen_30_part_10